MLSGFFIGSQPEKDTGRRGRRAYSLNVRTVVGRSQHAVQQHCQPITAFKGKATTEFQSAKLLLVLMPLDRCNMNVYEDISDPIEHSLIVLTGTFHSVLLL